MIILQYCEVMFWLSGKWTILCRRQVYLGNCPGYREILFISISTYPIYLRLKCRLILDLRYVSFEIYYERNYWMVCLQRYMERVALGFGSFQFVLFPCLTTSDNYYHKTDTCIINFFHTKCYNPSMVILVTIFYLFLLFHF